LTFLNRQIKKYYRKTLGYSTIRYILEFIFLAFLLKIIASFLGFAFSEILYDDFYESQNSKVYDYQQLGNYELIVIAILIAPIFETIINQWLAISIFKMFTDDYLCIILLSGISFAFFHLSYNVMYAIAMLPYGIIFSWVFYCKQKESLWAAHFFTFSIHAGNNSISIIAGML